MTVTPQGKKKKRSKRGKNTEFPTLEETLNTWMLDKTSTQIYRDLNVHLISSIMSSKKDYCISNKIQSIIKLWCITFMKGFELCLRQKTRFTQKLSAELKDNILCNKHHHNLAFSKVILMNPLQIGTSRCKKLTIIAWQH